MSSLVTSKYVNKYSPSNIKPKKGGLLTFGSSNRFSTKDERPGPGPKYHYLDSYKDNIKPAGPAFAFGTGTSSRGSFMSNVIRNDVMLNNSVGDAQSNNMGPAAYKPDYRVNKDVDPRVLWGSSKSERFQDKSEGGPGPKYMSEEKYHRGPRLAPKPNDLTVGDYSRYRSEDEQQLRLHQQAQHNVVMTSHSISPKNSVKAKHHSSFNRRLPPTMFMGKKFAVVGAASPGPYPASPTANQSSSAKQYISYPRAFTV
jgi:hypothetical protein